MDRPETLSLLRHAHDEVVMLRRRMADLEPKAHAYDTIAVLARQSVQPESQGYGVDVAWRLKKAVEEIEAERDRDTDAARQGGDAKAAPVPQDQQAGAEGIAPE